MGDEPRALARRGAIYFAQHAGAQLASRPLLRQRHRQRHDLNERAPAARFRSTMVDETGRD